MRRELWTILVLGCLLILLLEAPAAYSAMSEDLEGPYPACCDESLLSPAETLALTPRAAEIRTAKIHAAAVQPTVQAALDPPPGEPQPGGLGS